MGALGVGFDGVASFVLADKIRLSIFRKILLPVCMYNYLF